MNKEISANACPNCEEEIQLESICCGFYNDGTKIIESLDIIPKVGMGVTRPRGTDRYAYTVTKIISDKKIEVTQDEKIPYHRGITEQQEYDHVPATESNGTTVTITKRNDRRWREVGTDFRHGAFFVGARDSYTDPSF